LRISSKSTACTALPFPAMESPSSPKPGATRRNFLLQQQQEE
jgi:hypothetical protein